MSEQLEQWVEQISGSGLPVFANTVRDVSSVTTARDSSARDLSDVVSHDAAMTARLIQIANSPLFNPLGRKIETISAAVVLMGFDAVRDLAVSLSVIDHMLKGGAHARVTQTMARSFHAAVQASSLAVKMGTDANEEVFVATLLRDVGEMAFWSKGGDAAVRLEHAFHTADDVEVAQQSELGFTLVELSLKLAEKWNLGALTQHSHDPDPPLGSTVGCIVNGHALAEVYEKFGWESAQSRLMITELAEELELDESELRKAVEQNISEAVSIAEKFGITIDEVLPASGSGQSTDPQQGTLSGGNLVDAPSKDKGPNDETPSDMLAARLSILGKIALGIENGRGRDELMQVLIDGLSESLHADGCCFMLLSPDHSQLAAKYVTGRMRSDVTIELNDSSVLMAALQDKKPQTVPMRELDEFQQAGLALMCGVHIGPREVGVLVAGLGEERPQLDSADALAVFRQFAQQVVLVLTQAG